jgi:hypothetical protein
VKKLLAILTLSLAIAVAALQPAAAQVQFKSQYGNTVDTVTSTAAKYLYVKPIVGFYKTVAVYFNADEISGTTAGTASLEVSTDSLHWSSYYASMDTSYNYSLQDVATPQGFRWLLKDFGDKYLRIKTAGSGTPSVKISAYYVARKENS